LLWTNQTIAPLKMLSSSPLFIIIYLPCHVLCFFHAQRTGRCFPSARFLNFRSQGKKEKKRKKKETIKNEEIQCMWELRLPSRTGMCMHKVSGTKASGFTFPQALGCLGEKAPGIAMGYFTRAQVLEELYTVGTEDLFRRLL